MSACCRAEPCQEIFGSATAKSDLNEYLRTGLGDLERRMLAAIPVTAVREARRVLEIGGGIGALQAELLLKGVAGGEVVELISEYEPYARRLGEELGLGARTTFRVADLIEEPAATEPADIVVLNRVVCCSADGVDLTRVAAGLTRHVLALSYPRPLALLRLAARLQEPVARLFRRRYRFYIHTFEALERAATSMGLRRLVTGHNLFWEYTVFTASAPDGLALGAGRSS